MRTGSSPDTQRAGSAACTPTGLSWPAAWTSSWTRTRARRRSVDTFTFRCYASRSHATCRSIDMCDAAPPGRDRGIGVWVARPLLLSCHLAIRVRIGWTWISISLLAASLIWQPIGKHACWPISPWSDVTTSHRCQPMNVIVSCWPVPSAIWPPWPTSDWRNIKRYRY